MERLKVSASNGTSRTFGSPRFPSLFGQRKVIGDRRVMGVVFWCIAGLRCSKLRIVQVWFLTVKLLSWFGVAGKLGSRP
jgi:hypothetical protein